MRKWLDLFESVEELSEEMLAEGVELPKTDYGYWIAPQGRIIVVPAFAHERVLEEITEGRMMTYRQAFEAGWVRIIATSGILFVTTSTGLIDARQIVAISAMAYQPDIEDYRADIAANYKEFTDKVPFMMFVKAHRARAEQPVEAKPGRMDWLGAWAKGVKETYKPE